MDGRRTALLVAAAAAAGAAAVWKRSTTQRPQVRTGSFANSIEYAALGSGPRTMLFLPGGPGTPTWDKAGARRVLPAYATGDYTVWWLSRRRNMPVGHSIADMADDVAAVIAELGGRVDAVVGASYGGLIAIHLAARHPHCVDRVVLLASSAWVPDEAKALDRDWGEAWGNRRFTEAGEALLAEALVGERMRPVRRILAPAAGLGLAWMSGAYNLPDILVETQAEAEYDARGVLPLITAPVLIVAGSTDIFLPREAIEDTARGIADCRIIWHEGEGHVRTISGRRTAEEVMSFLRGT